MSLRDKIHTPCSATDVVTIALTELGGETDADGIAVGGAALSMIGLGVVGKMARASKALRAFREAESGTKLLPQFTSSTIDSVVAGSARFRNS
jgi:hypothetical protein